jgi:hypothetical protein
LKDVFIAAVHASSFREKRGSNLWTRVHIHSLKKVSRLTANVQSVVFMPGGLTTEVKALEANGHVVSLAQAGDIVGFTVAAPAHFVRSSSHGLAQLCLNLITFQRLG